MRVELHPEAGAELIAQIEYYNDQQTGLGKPFYNEVISSLEVILKSPEIYRLRKDHRRKNLKIFPFYIAFSLEEHRIWVLAIAHAHRKPDYWKRRIGRK